MFYKLLLFNKNEILKGTLMSHGCLDGQRWNLRKSQVLVSVPLQVSAARVRAALNISTGPLALHTFQTTGPVRASTLYLSLALQDHRVKCRASRLKNNGGPFDD